MENSEKINSAARIIREQPFNGMAFTGAGISVESGIPVIYGVLTTENIEQAIERSGTKAGNRGFDVAVSAIEMANLAKNMKQKGKK